MRYSDKVAHGIRVIQLPTWSVAAGAYLARVSKQKHATEPVQLVPRGASHLPICLTTASPRSAAGNQNPQRSGARGRSEGILYIVC